MPHENTQQSHWHDPDKGKNAGYGAWKRPNTPYDNFMEAQEIPIFRGIGVHRVQDLPLAPWKRMGGKGSYIQLYGTEASLLVPDPNWFGGEVKMEDVGVPRSQVPAMLRAVSLLDDVEGLVAVLAGHASGRQTLEVVERSVGQVRRHDVL